jgi:hypothetical protein
MRSYLYPAYQILVGRNKGKTLKNKKIKKERIKWKPKLKNA